MTKRILIFLFLLLTFEAIPQATNSWLSNLKNLKDKFYRQDTISFTFDLPSNGDFLAYSKLLQPITKNDCDIFFAKQSEHYYCEYWNEIFFYSYSLSDSNFATLTFLSFGRYTPILTLFNYSPTGKLINQVELKSSFIDAGLADSFTNNLFPLNYTSV